MNDEGRSMTAPLKTRLLGGLRPLGGGLVVAASLCAATGAVAQATAPAEGATQGIFPENPRRDDPALDLQRLRREGVAHYEAGLALETALARFLSAFERSGGADDAFNVALTHFRRNDTQSMTDWLGKALSVDPRHPNAHYLMGVQAKGEGDFEAALAHWRTAAETAPDDPHLRYQLALIARSFRDETGFLQGLIDTLNLDPDHPGALYQMYRYYRIDGNTPAAQETMKRFTAVKRKERFSRREKSKDPSLLARPIAGRLDGPAPQRETGIRLESERRPAGCTLASVHVAPDLVGEDLVEYLIGICDTGEVLRFDPRGGAPERLGGLPEGAADVFVEALDATGRRVVARAGGALVASNAIGTGPLAFTELGVAHSAAVPGDIDSDGDLDMVFTGGELPLTNAGDMTFRTEFQVYEGSPLPGLLAGAADVAVVDLRRIGNADFVAVAGSEVRLVAGDVLGYKDAWALDAGVTPTGVGVEDLDGSGQPDFVVTSAAGVAVIWDPQPTAAPATAPETVLAAETFGRALTADFDNDGLIDVLAMGPAGTLRVLPNRGGRSFGAVQEVMLDAPSTGLVAADVNADGKLDLIHGDAGGNLVVATNASDAGHSVRMLLRGVRSAPSGLMTQVEVRSGRHYTYLQSRGGVVHAGLGDDPHAEVVRIEWTNGFVENKLKVDAVVDPYVFEESERISGSCPSVFAWNGERFRYISDAFISGPMGVPLDRGVYFPIGDRETMVLRGDDLDPLDGSLQFRFTEELRETVYLDRIELAAVDHPAGSVVAPNSRLAPAPPAPDEIYVSLRRAPIVDARASNGADVTDALARADGVHADYFEPDRNPGFAEPHWIEFTLPGEVDAGDVDALLARGWFHYFDSTSMISEAQSTGGRIGWPMLEEKVDGAWRTVGPLGLPAGKDKYAVMPLGGKLRSRVLRIVSEVSVYWDRIELSLAGGTADVAAPTPLTLEEANLRFRGLSRMTQRHPERFDYHSVSYMTMWNPMVGRYTAYGAVDDLVSHEDGVYAVFGTGDEIALRFSPPAEGPAPGMARSYLLRFIGFVKDGDRYTSDADRVDPLPFLGMRSYPARPPLGYVAREAAMMRTREPLDFTLSAVSKDR